MVLLTLMPIRGGSVLRYVTHLRPHEELGLPHKGKVSASMDSTRDQQGDDRGEA